MDSHNDQIVDLDNQDYNQGYDYQNGMDNYVDDPHLVNDMPIDNIDHSNQIDSTLGIHEPKDSATSNKSSGFDPLGQILPG